ncbi:MAG: ABC transporter permease, partial [Acidobacteriia bacterium]|nr:ABC transporter permease [Terriglobia bacterium]
MSRLRAVISRALDMFRMGSQERRLKEELQSHLDMLIEDYERCGRTPAEASREARLRLGGIDQTKEAVRDALGIRMVRDLLQDVHYAFRGFRRSPWFSAGVVLTLALGIGANGAVFSILQAVLLQPLPYRDPDRLVMVWRAPKQAPAGEQNQMLWGSGWQRGILTREMVFDWREESASVFDGFAGNSGAQFDLTLGDRAERLRGALVTPNFFDVLGVKAVAGRLFAATDETSAEPLLVLSDRLWRRAFGADPGIVGRRITLVGDTRPRRPRTFAVIGVLPPAFRFTYPDETEAWVLEPWRDLARQP